MKNLTGRTLALFTAFCMAGCAASADDNNDSANTDESSEELGSTNSALTASYAPPACGSACVSSGTLAAMNAAAKKYGFPRWFIYATVHRESSFNPSAKNVTGDGTKDGDTGYGLTQITGQHHIGVSYPETLSAPNQNNSLWQGDMRISKFCTETGLCPWIDMKNVSPLATTNDRFNPAKNLDRYFSGYAAPAFYLEAKRSPKQSGETTAAFNNRILRRVAWHWRYGHYASFTYPTDPSSYLSGSGPYHWDNYAATYRAAVEKEDGVWNGNVCKPPYSAAGCSGTSASSGSSSSGGTTAAPESCETNDTSDYNFECDSEQGWKASSTALITSVSSVTTKPYNGTGSLAITLGGSTGTRGVSVKDGAMPTAGKTVSFRLWVPSGSKISWVQPYVQEGAGGNWRWNSTTKNIGELSQGAWNTITVAVPASAKDVASIGLQLGVSSAWSGTVYLDSVNW